MDHWILLIHKDALLPVMFLNTLNIYYILSTTKINYSNTLTTAILKQWMMMAQQC